ncbi:nucleotidyltransferase domain-containing protein [Clostridium butyricum]|uniref:nucleotidyltransferase domain-containing protein n=1 Tax=Clostridium TaxID=1485 RepID=UPI001FA80301|nr:MULTISPECIES: nucleotidyltransferase domain-containing protein [Clostridium]
MPSYTQIYVFGSVLKSCQPGDLDIIVVYDSKAYPNAKIYNACKDMNKILFETFKLPIDLTVLSYSENDSINFVKEVKAIELKHFLRSRFLNKRI